jgi:hypothetical protein
MERNMIRRFVVAAGVGAAVLGGVAMGLAPVASADVYYKNCAAARDAGAAPVHKGDPGYGPHLDRDGDGVGCES